jgi:hypothetical protein
MGGQAMAAVLSPPFPCINLLMQVQRPGREVQDLRSTRHLKVAGLQGFEERCRAIGMALMIQKMLRAYGCTPEPRPEVDPRPIVATGACRPSESDVTGYRLWLASISCSEIRCAGWSSAERWAGIGSTIATSSDEALAMWTVTGPPVRPATAIRFVSLPRVVLPGEEDPHFFPHHKGAVYEALWKIDAPLLAQVSGQGL